MSMCWRIWKSAFRTRLAKGQEGFMSPMFNSIEDLMKHFHVQDMDALSKLLQKSYGISVEHVTREQLESFQRWELLIQPEEIVAAGGNCLVLRSGKPVNDRQFVLPSEMPKEVLAALNIIYDDQNWVLPYRYMTEFEFHSEVLALHTSVTGGNRNNLKAGPFMSVTVRAIVLVPGRRCNKIVVRGTFYDELRFPFRFSDLVKSAAAMRP